MSVWDDYSREEKEQQNKVTGKLRCVIVDVEEGVSKSSGLPMITIYVRPSGTTFKVRTWLVHNDKFNVNAAKFFDAFPEIKDGDFNLLGWIGAEGAANFGENDNGYLDVKNWVFPRQAESLPPFEGEKPERQVISSIMDEDDDPSDEDLPWA